MFIYNIRKRTPSEFVVQTHVVGFEESLAAPPTSVLSFCWPSIMSSSPDGRGIYLLAEHSRMGIHMLAFDLRELLLPNLLPHQFTA